MDFPNNQLSIFADRHLGLSASDQAKMLDLLGHEDLDDFISSVVPQNILDDNPPIEGIGEAGYETFVLYPYEEDLGCCKTGRRPYDEIVVAVLNRAAERCPEKFFWHSDGDWEDHEAGLTLQYSQPARKQTTPYYCVTY